MSDSNSKDSDSKSSKAAKKSWDIWIHKIHGELFTWKIVAIITLIMLFITLGFSGYYFVRPKHLPYVIEVNEKGEASFKGHITPNSITIDNAMTRNYLIRFIKDIRTVSTDLVFYKQNLQDAYYLVTKGSGVQRLNEYYNELNPLERAADGTLHIDIRFRSFDKLAESTWRVEWIEFYRKDGKLFNTITKAGTFTYEQSSALTKEDAEKNPLGIYFSNFNIVDVREL